MEAGSRIRYLISGLGAAIAVMETDSHTIAAAQGLFMLISRLMPVRTALADAGFREPDVGKTADASVERVALGIPGLRSPTRLAHPCSCH
jgi:hypothetical protein